MGLDGLYTTITSFVARAQILARPQRWILVILGVAAAGVQIVLGRNLLTS